MTKTRVRLIHWDPIEGRRRAAALRQAGYTVDTRPFTGGTIRELRQRAPDAVVIDLSRLPAQGRDVGIALRTYRDTRNVPIVFIDGETAKVRMVKAKLPDAVYATWPTSRSAVAKAIRRPPAKPVSFTSVMAGYEHTPLLKKLGIGPDSVTVLARAPADFQRVLGELPSGATVRLQNRGRRDLTMWFVTRSKDVERDVRAMGTHAANGGLWIVWPKKNTSIRTDLTQAVVRKIGLAHGLVDYKVAAIDATWTGLRFTRRRAR